MFLLAKIVKTRGNKGEVVCTFPTASIESLKTGCKVVLQRGGNSREAEVESLRTVNESDLIKFKGVDSIGDAYQLIGCAVFLENYEVTEPSDDDTAAFIGWTLCGEDGSPIGEIVDLLDRTLQPLFVVRDGEGAEHLVPLVDEWVVKTDAPGMCIVMSLPEGLIGIN